jgi:hypothetical protein
MCFNGSHYEHNESNFGAYEENTSTLEEAQRNKNSLYNIKA